jgi:REP element-mobilizing transposase RayT
MAIAYHVVCGLYGFWLPNDPRGSWSRFVASARLLRFGKATKTADRRSRARLAHDGRLRRAAKQALEDPPVCLSGRQARAVGRGFAQVCAEGGYAVHACSILPDHVHLVVGRHARRLARVVGHMKTRATQRLKAEGLWPGDGCRVWGGPGWCVYLDTPEEVRQKITYVETNPLKEGKPRQRWSFVKPFRG